MSKRPGKVSLSAKFMQADKASFGAIRANTLRLGSALETVVAKKVQVTESMAVKKVQVSRTFGVNEGTDSGNKEKMVIGDIVGGQSPQIELFTSSQTVTGTSGGTYQTSISGDVYMGGQIHTLKEIRGRDQKSELDPAFSTTDTYSTTITGVVHTGTLTYTNPDTDGLWKYGLSQYDGGVIISLEDYKRRLKNNPMHNLIVSENWALPDKDGNTDTSGTYTAESSGQGGTVPNVIELNTRADPGVLFINSRIYSGIKENFNDTQETLAIGDCKNHQKLRVHGMVKMDSGVANNSAINSDDRLKHNEAKITGALDTVNKLNPMVYDKTQEMLGADFKGPLDPQKTPFFKESGFIAQDVEQIPELKHMVTPGTSTTPYGLNYNGFIAYLVKAVQELSTKVEEQGAELRALQNGSSSSSST